jgi:hypothetical protein
VNAVGLTDVAHAAGVSARRCNWRFAASATRRQWRNCERCGSSGRGARWRMPDGTVVRSPRSPPRRASARSPDSRPTTKPALAYRRPKRCAGASRVEIGGLPWRFTRPAAPNARRGSRFERGLRAGDVLRRVGTRLRQSIVSGTMGQRCRAQERPPQTAAGSLIRASLHQAIACTVMRESHPKLSHRKAILLFKDGA